ncbi:hypothetical protein ACM44_13420 [Chryseobacterium koreense CCUG 49689]|uniref:Uncharacterized protein n=2 Tax=Chryseobacterium koreense TaxID=232216 RepID=A0A0J7IWB7_9FLAO|nr:hypothetical protein [Chryseobacterium koreense]KMQ70247.1 hypothetical protein ACM44_13420 [Chryseobacterium koreense CCUG 49689]MBB5334748.1 hypothetical protein [Chryseobacterium koreense]
MNKVQQGQTFLDMVLQLTGDFSEVIEASLLNDKSLSEDVAIGTEITVKMQATSMMSNRPATAIMGMQTNIPIERGGIGYMEIGKTFKVN